MMKLGMLLNRLICDAHAKFRVSSFKNVIITADTHTYRLIAYLTFFQSSKIYKNTKKMTCVRLFSVYVRCVCVAMPANSLCLIQLIRGHM